MSKVYITTPIYYVNDKPHIGSCYTNLIADVLARLYTMCGNDVRFQTGTDEHGQKIAQSSEKQNMHPMKFCNIISKKFKDLAIDMNLCCSYEKFDCYENFNQFNHTIQNRDSDILFNNGQNFIRTTEGRDIENGLITADSKKDGRHIKAVEKFWNQLKDNGWLYKSKYSGWYAVQDEAFYTDSEVSEIENGVKIATSGSLVNWREEEAYFFKLSKLQNFLLNIYKKHNIVAPYSKMSEVLSFVSNGLSDICVSRLNLSWGIPVPDDNNHSIYVWLDALINYISALDYGSDNDDIYNKWWKENTNVIHIIGKDILRFHAVYWPAFLFASKYSIIEINDFKNINISNECCKNTDSTNSKDCSIAFHYDIPFNIFAHGWWTNDGNKISKSLGNAIDPYQEIDWLKNTFNIDHCVALDYLRYFLLRAMPLGNDGDYSRDRLVQIINTELVNNIGNFIYRLLPIVQKNCNSGRDLVGVQSDLMHNYITTMKNMIYNCSLDQIISIITNDNDEGCLCINKYVDEKKPWTLINNIEKVSELRIILRTVLERIIHIAIILRSFTPHIAESVLDYLNWPKEMRSFSHMEFENYSNFSNVFDDILVSGLKNPKHFFPRLI